MNQNYPLGYRINNPGDLRNEGILWQGLQGSEEGFCLFSDPVHGIRALLKDLHTKWAKDGLRTVRAIVEKFAPPGDDNPTETYILHVSTYAGVSDSDTLDFDSNYHAQLVTVARGMIRQELSGGADAPSELPPDWYSDDQYRWALNSFDPDMGQNQA